MFLAEVLNLISKKNVGGLRPELSQGSSVNFNFSGQLQFALFSFTSLLVGNSEAKHCVRGQDWLHGTLGTIPKQEAPQGRRLHLHSCKDAAIVQGYTAVAAVAATPPMTPVLHVLSLANQGTLQAGVSTVRALARTTEKAHFQEPFDRVGHIYSVLRQGFQSGMILVVLCGLHRHILLGSFSLVRPRTATMAAVIFELVSGSFTSRFLGSCTELANQSSSRQGAGLYSVTSFAAAHRLLLLVFGAGHGQTTETYIESKTGTCVCNVVVFMV